jgi:hypothetical protein
LLLLPLAVCGGDAARQVRIELLHRSSCGVSTARYDTSCLQAVTVQMVSTDGRRFRKQCTLLGGSYPTLQDLLASTRVEAFLEDVRARSSVFIELKAFHGLGGKLCPDPPDSGLMLWGVSEIVDLTDPTVDVVALPFECRPSCDCEAIDAGDCTQSLLPGVCAPPPRLYCRKQCAASQDCFDGLASCTGACEPGVGPSGATCCEESSSKGMCSYCAGDADCASRRCVLNRHDTEPNDPPERFCAESCPALPDVSPCPSGMSCRKVGDGVIEPG